jgi:hypothetical protein
VVGGRTREGHGYFPLHPSIPYGRNLPIVTILTALIIENIYRIVAKCYVLC